MSSKKKPDWEKIELEYRAGVKTIVQIGADHGAKESTIRARAKKNGWTRDLQTRIKLRADELVNQDAIRSAARKIDKAENETVDENAQLLASVRLSHRKDIQRSRVAAMSLLEELEGTIGEANRERLDVLLSKIIDVEDGIDSDDWRAIAAYKRATSLSAAVGNMQKLADTMVKLVNLERQAHGLDDVDNSPVDALTSLLHSIANANGNAFGVVKSDPDYKDDDAPSNTLGVKSDVDD